MIRMIADVVAPVRCVNCGGQSDGDLCRPCAGSLVVLSGSVCIRCGAPDPQPRPHCPGCIGLTGFRRARSLLVYGGPAARLTVALKHRGRPGLANEAGTLLGDLALARALGGPAATVTFVPGGREADRRGYDHAELLARAVARRLSLRCARLLRRAGHGPRQSEVPLDQRISNAKGRFAAARARGPVLLVDDVFTTGATVDACALALLVAGASSVDAVTLARTPRLRPR